MSNEVEIVVRSRDQSGPAIDAAIRRLRLLKEEGESIRDVHINVDVDAGEAIAELAAVREARDRVDGKDANVNVDADVGAALAKIALVGAALAGLAAAGAGIGIAAGVGAVGALGFGAVAAGLSGVGNAVSAMGQKVGGAGGAAASTAKAVRGAAEQIIQAKEGVVRAERDLEAAHRDVATAERDLTHTQREAKDAQDQLNDAREQAKEDLEDLNDAVAQSALDQRQASQDVQKAKQELDAVTSNTFATDEQRAASQLAYDEALQHQTRLTHETARLKEDQAEAAKKGVEGSDKVKQAHQRVEDAVQRVADAQQHVRDAVLKVTEAQEHLADANRQVAIAQQNAADAAKSAGSSGAGGINKLAQAMANLSPAGQKFARFMRGFIDGPLKELRFAAQEGLLPPIQASLEKLGPVIHKLAPAFQSFSGAIGNAIGGGIGLLGKMAGPLLKFATVALQALSPLGGVFSGFATAFGTMVDKVTKNGSLKGAMDGFAQIVGAITDNLPGLVEVGLGLAKILGPATADLIRALLPLVEAIANAIGPTLAGAVEAVLPVITGLTDWINNNQGLFSDLVTLILLIVGAIKIWTAVQGILDAVMDANPIVLVILAIAALVILVILAYRHSETFRKIVQEAGRKAAEAFGWVKDKVMELVHWVQANFPKVKTAITNAIGTAVAWVRDKWNGLMAFFHGIPGRISGTAKGMWDSVKNAARDAVQWVTDKFNGLLDFVRGIPGQIAGAVGGALSSLGGLVPGFSSGGISHAAEGGPRSNLAMVGEHGRELVRLPFGSSVIPHGQTEGMLGGRGGGGHVVLEIRGSGNAADDFLAEMLRRYVRTRGGNVQTILGRS